MSNLLKRGTTISKSERVIDYNDVIRNKLLSMMEHQDERKIDPDGFVTGLNADVVEPLISDEEDAESAASLEEEDQSAATLEDMNLQAEQIIEDANKQAEEILAKAKEQAEQIQKDAEEQGLQDGAAKAEQELNRQQEEMNAQYKKKNDELEKDYQIKREQMEPELVEIITEVFRKVTKTVSEDNEDIILHLINNVIKNSELSKSFTIKVSPADYDFVASNQGKIYMASNSEIQLDIVDDVTMNKDECLIETDNGVFNCSLDIELNNLIKDIKLLSCV